MRLAKMAMGADTCLGVIDEADRLELHDWRGPYLSLSDVLCSGDPLAAVKVLPRRPKLETAGETEPPRWLAPIDRHEVWAAGVTYKRSQVARMEESETGASHYDRVYTAPRPELFFKATPHRVVGPHESVRIRQDAQWSVPEPEFALVLSPSLQLVGFTIGNDMSARDIEGENPLYLPQAKVYNQCCALGPCVLVPPRGFDRAGTRILLKIDRQGQTAFQGETSLSQMQRSFEELIDWLGRDNHFPHGAILLTGTGIVPPNDFTLAAGDLVRIEVPGIGVLSNPVVQGS